MLQKIKFNMLFGGIDTCFSMFKFDDLSLSKFLSKPRFLYEVAEHYGISEKLAEFHLQEAVKSGQVLVSKRPVFQTLRLSDGRMKRFSGFVYVFGKSSVLMNRVMKLSIKEPSGSPEAGGEAASIRFLSNTDALKAKEVSDRKLPSSRKEGTSDSRVDVHRFRTSGSLVSQFGTSRSKVKLARTRTIDRLLRHVPRSVEEEVKSISQVERIRLFRALLKEPLPFLDLHGRFGVSKQIVKGLVKNGFLREMWGPKAIGVRFTLTNKGRVHLKELEAAARYEPTVRDTAFFQLKQRSPV